MIYVGILVFILIQYILVQNRLMKKKTAIVLITILLIIIAGLRNPELGMTDTLTGYLPAWNIAGRVGWKELIANYVGNANSGLKDIGFAVFCKLLNMISNNPMFFLLMTVIPYIVAYSVYIYKQSQNFFMSYFLFLALNLYTCGFYMIRHIMAAAFIIWALKYLYEKKFWKFLILVVIASTFHASAVIFIFAYPMVWFQARKRTKGILDKLFGKYKYFVLAVITVVIGITYRDVIISLISLFTKSSRFETAGGGEGSLGRFLIAIVMLIICLYETRGCELSEKKENRISLILSAITCILYAFMPVMADFHRFAKFYEMVNVVWLPNCIKQEKKTINRYVLKWGIYTILSIYMFTRLLPGINALDYSFFWDFYR